MVLMMRFSNLTTIYSPISQGQIITGAKTLQGPVLFETHLHVDTVNDVDIGALEQTVVYDYGDQTIVGHKTFTGRDFIWNKL